jgi:nitrite reductase (NADH) small subunit
MPEASTDAPAGKAPEHRIGRLADFPAHKVVPVEVAGRTIGVLRADDKVFAFSNRCPHQGAPMSLARAAGTMLPSEPDEYDFGLDGLIVKCPWHAYEFNVETGESVCKIMRARLPVYRTDIRDNEVFLTFGKA